MQDPDQSSLVMNLIHLLQAYLKRLGDIIQLASLEARLAIKTLFSLAALFFILFILLSSSWLCVLFLLCVFIQSLGYSLVFSAVLITSLNIILLALCSLIMWRLKQNLFFPATRKEIYNTAAADKECDHDKLKKTNP
jgi:Putative Actinobacterial Holin-X, holin superfamily III